MRSASYVYMSESGQQSRQFVAGKSQPQTPGGESRMHRDHPNQMEALAQTVELALDEKSDEVLITLFQQGERDAFRILVERYHARIKNLIYSIFHEPSVIDDLSQEVFIKAYEALPQFRFQSSFYTWLYRIAVNKSRDELRKRKIRRFFSLQTMMESNDQDFHSKATIHPEDNEVRELVAKSLQALPEKYRLPIILKDIDGLSYEEIAEVMECEIGTVKSRLSRARSMLREILKPLLKEM